MSEAIDSTELAPRKGVRRGDRTTAFWSSGYSELLEYDGRRWIRIATFDPRLYPKCWTLPDGTRQADQP